MRAVEIGLRCRRLLAGLAIGVAATVAAGSVAAAAGPFDGLAGVWTGSGTVTYASGTKESLSCRAQYVSSSATNLQQALRCASDSYNFQINASFDSTNGNLSGRWSEVVNDIAGSVKGTVAGGRISGQLSGPTFVADLTVVTKGDQQQVNINAPIQDIRTVSIQMKKSAK